MKQIDLAESLANILHSVSYNEVKAALEQLHFDTGCETCKSEGIDKCFRGELPGVYSACCGHGKEGYIQFENGMVIRGIFTEMYHKDDPCIYIEQDGVVGITRNAKVIAQIRKDHEGEEG
jgi:hypothetical protein